MFIVLEGCDGSGKSTIRKFLVSEIKRITGDCFEVGQHSWLDPVAARVIVAVRENRFSGGKPEIFDAYAKDKYLHGEWNVKPGLKKCGVVVADRWLYSDAVYHEALYGIPAEETLRRHYMQGTIRADVVIRVRLDAEEAYRRILSRGRFTKHYERPVDLSKINAAYDRVLKILDERVVEFENDQPDVQKRVISLLPNILS